MAVAVFQSGLDAGLYDAAILAWVLSFLVEGRIIRSGGERSTEVKADRGSAFVILVSLFVAIAVANIFARSEVALLPKPFFYFGLVMMLAGMAFRFWAVSTLRTFFSYTVEIKREHRVVEAGPYRIVRHPAYAGSLLTILGVGFALQTWGAVVTMAFMFLVAFGYRIRVEERALVGSLGEEYLSYAKRVKRIVPFVF